MKENLKLAVIGGGSSYTPELIEGILTRAARLPVREVWLVDIPEGEYKLRTIAALARRMVRRAGVELKIVDTLDRRAAIEGADFVVTQLRVGGLDARAKDESIPLKYGVIGQETTGPGGYAKALRTIPVILDICRDIEELSPNAWLINFTNPAGINTEAILNYSKVRALGLCNVPINIKKDIAKVLGVDSARIGAQFMGLNHMSFVTSVTLDGEEILPRLLDLYENADPDTLKQLEDVSDALWDPAFIRSMGMITNPYHRYYYKNRKMLEEERESMAKEGSRAMQVKEIERRLFELYSDENLCEKPKELEKRGGAYYSEAAISLIDAIYNNKNEIHTVNLKNCGAIADLPYDAVIEANALIGAHGATPLTLGKMPEKVAGLISSVKAYERLAVRAAVEGSYDAALIAMMANPFIDDFDTGKAILDELIAAHGEYLAYLK